MKKILLGMAGITGLLLVGGGGYWLGSLASPKPQNKSATQATSAPPAITVEAGKVAQMSLPQGITAVGSLRSDESITLRPEVAGRISEILFKEGQRVAQGTVLVRFDASVQRAEFEQAKANLQLNKSKFERAVDLQKKGFISSQAREEAENNYRVSEAAAELANAKLSKLVLRAPFSGIVGLRTVSVGDYVKDGQDIVNLEGIDPLKVDFKVPEIYLKQVAVGQALQIGLDAFPNQIYEGKVFAINPLVDANGRSIVIRAVIKNGEARLRPGMFARIRLLFSDNRDSLVVPEQALIPVGDDQYVFKVVDGRAQRVKIDIGQRREGRVEVLQGLRSDDVVVTAGQLKLRDGVPVKVVSPATTGLPAEKGPTSGNGNGAVSSDSNQPVIQKTGGKS